MLREQTMNDPQLMMSRDYPIWPPPPPPEDPMAAFQSHRAVLPSFAPCPNRRRAHWKVKKAGAAGPERRFYPKKRFARFAPTAPRNTTSFIIRAKKSGGIAPLVSPCPVTPAVLPTPTFSPSPREGLAHMAKEEFGVDAYGTMKGFICLRTPDAVRREAAEEAEGGSAESESEVEEHVEMERRVDHDLSRFKMVLPAHGEEVAAASASTSAHLLGSRVEEQEMHIVELEEENLTLKGRMFLVEQEMGDLRRRLQLLETGCHDSGEEEAKEGDADETGDAAEVVSENGTDGGGGSECHHVGAAMVK